MAGMPSFGPSRSFQLFHRRARVVIGMAVSDVTFGPVLRDGTPLSELMDPDHYEVSMRLLADPEIYRWELETLFGRGWNLLGHESEVPESGDYVMRHIGEDPVIVTRDRSGGINVLLNVCTHRGMTVCRAEGGKGTQFKCPYHGWTFSNTGRFLGAPIASEEMHGAFRSKDELGLPKARVELCAGFIFANWDESAPSLDEWLGDIKWYFEMMFDRTPEGLEVIGSPQRFIVNANWKCAGEQNNVDGFHTVSLHQSLNDLAMMAGADDSGTAQIGVNISANGAGLRCLRFEDFILNLQGKLTPDMSPLERLMVLPPAGLSPEQVPALAERFDEGQLRVLAEWPPSVGGLFPNVFLASFPFPLGDAVSAVITVHVWTPKGPDKFEFINWTLVERAASQEMRDTIRRTSNLAMGISGFVESDDADTWPQMTQMAGGVMGGRQKIRYGALTGEGTKPADWPGPGHVYAGQAKDDCQWNWWRRYFELMTAAEVGR
jgi:nitrite reductase/ring-hydroxylating ferredoxin subunit